MNIGQALDPTLLGAALGDMSSWKTWRTVLKATFGLALNRDEARVFASVAGSRAPPKTRVRELWAICGRRSGKSKIAAALGCFFALFTNPRLSPGEIGCVAIISASRDQSQAVFGYLKGYFDSSPVLKREVANVTASEITLRSGIVLSVHSNSFRTVRGRTLLCAILDEVAFFRDESSATPDLETYRAILPALASTNGMLVGISTPYRKLGLLYQKHRNHFGVDGDDVLVVSGNTRSFNPTLSEQTIAAQRAADPTSASSEWDANFRDDIATFLDDALIDAAIMHDRPLELPPRQHPGFYRAFTDSAGGTGRDAYTLAIAHKEAERCIIDVVRGTRPGQKFDPKTADPSSRCAPPAHTRRPSPLLPRCQIADRPQRDFRDFLAIAETAHHRRQQIRRRSGLHTRLLRAGIPAHGKDPDDTFRLESRNHRPCLRQIAATIRHRLACRRPTSRVGICRRRRVDCQAADRQVDVDIFACWVGLLRGNRDRRPYSKWPCPHLRTSTHFRACVVAQAGSALFAACH
jgi:hypothetical protein